MAKKISISFKETKRDQQLWEIISQMDDKSYEIKEILRKALINKENSKETETKKETVNIMDF